VAPGDREVPPSSLHRFRLAALRLRHAIVLSGFNLCVLFERVDADLDQEMLCHERVS